MQIAICGADRETLDITAGDQTDDYVDRSAADLLVTVGEAPLIESATRGETRPILAVGLDSPVSPSRQQLAALLEGGLERLPTVEIRPLVVTADGHESTAVFDTTLITSEPARISEYGLSVAGRPHASFRADGVVVATPLGSSGYGRAAGGPQLMAGTGVAVVPIAPFATIADTWVVEPPLSVSVERDNSVTVYADSDRLTAGTAGLAVEIGWGQPISILDWRAADSP